MRPSAALFLAGLLPVIAAHFANGGATSRWGWELRVTLPLLPFVLIGCFAPSPLFAQYFYPLVPFVVLAGLYAWASIPAASVWFRRSQCVGVATTLLSVALAIRAFADFRDFLDPREWTGTKLHHRPQELPAHIPRGRVLTLAPAYPLAAGLGIYPAFPTGPSARRISPFVEPAPAIRLSLFGPTTLGAASLPNHPSECPSATRISQKLPSPIGPQCTATARNPRPENASSG